MPSLETQFNNLEKWFVKRMARALKKHADKNIVKPMRQAIRKTKGPSKPGEYPKSRTGKFRKLIQARRKFQGALRKQSDGSTPVLKVKPWTPVGNVLRSEKSGKRHRKTTPREVWRMIQQTDNAALNEVRPELNKKMHDIFRSAIRGNRPRGTRHLVRGNSSGLSIEITETIR